jgi:hypothetical protein
VSLAAGAVRGAEAALRASGRPRPDIERARERRRGPGPLLAGANRSEE